MSALPETFPAISVDIGLGKHVNSFEVDIPAITEHLQQGNVPDEKIGSLAVHFSDRNKKSAGTITLGRYNPFKHRISVHYENQLEVANTLKTTEFDTYTSNLISGTTAHELEHVVARFDTPFRKKEARHRRKHLGIFAVGVLGSYTTAYGATLSTIGNNLDSGTLTAPAAGTAAGFFAINYLFKNLYKTKYYQESPEEIRCRNKQAEPRQTHIVATRHKK